MSSAKGSTTTRVVVASTVMLSFISFWRGAAIVLSDLASSAFYAGGIAEGAIGRSAPWFILGVMLFSFAVRSLYVESCSMYVRGGVYVVVRDAMGPFLARLSVSAIIFDYILTGPISAVSAGHYLGRLINEISEMMNSGMLLAPSQFAAAFALVVTVYFWRSNIKGIHESSGKALRIMQITTVMVVLFLVWCAVTLLMRGPAQIPPPPTPSNLEFGEHDLGWLTGWAWIQIPAVAIIIAFGHSVLAMSGFETLAQVYREIASPKLKNLKITANIVCIYAVVATGVITLLAAMIIPDSIRPQYVDNLLGGLAMHLAGPQMLRLAFHAFVVIVGVLILSGAVNTSIIGANGDLNRLAEDGVLMPWFRQPHKKFGTSYRLINAVVILQLATILASRGDVRLLGAGLRLWSRLEFLHESPGRSGAEVPANRSGVQDTAERDHRGQGVADWPDRHHPRPVLHCHREPFHETNRDDRRHCLLSVALRCVHNLEPHECEGTSVQKGFRSLQS